MSVPCFSAKMRMERSKIFFVLCLGALVFAGAVPLAHAMDCTDATNTGDREACAEKSLDKAQAELGKISDQLIALMKSQDVQKLQLSEESWKKFRQKQCEFETSGTLGGTVHLEMLLLCKAYYTTQYARDLRRQLDCTEGDLSCVGHFPIYLYQNNNKAD